MAGRSSKPSDRSAINKGLFEPRSLAVIGASPHQGKVGYALLENIIGSGYTGDIYPVNPKEKEVQGLKAYPSVKDIPGEVDLAIIIIPARAVPDVVTECTGKGIPFAVVISAGFREVGIEGRKLERDMVQRAHNGGMRIMGPNCLGIMNTDLPLNASFSRIMPPKGSIGVISQSGAILTSLLDWAVAEGVGFSKMISLGNSGDLVESEIIDALAKDDETAMIAMYIEGVSDGGRFFKSLAKAYRRKPVVILKAGTTQAGARAASSHTGALAGSHEIFMGALAQTGAVPVGDFEEMFDCAKAFAYCPLPAGNRLGVVSVTGAGCSLAADACEARGLTVPPLSRESLRYATEGLPAWASFNNPADIWAAIMAEGNAGAYYKLMRAMASQDDIDMLLAVFTIAPQFEFDVAGVIDRIRVEFPEKPVLTTVLWGASDDSRRWFESLEGARIPMYPSIERAVAAAGALNRYSSWLRRQR